VQDYFTVAAVLGTEVRLFKSHYRTWDLAMAQDDGEAIDIQMDRVRRVGYGLSESDVVVSQCRQPLDQARCCYCGDADWRSLYKCDGSLYSGVGPNALPCVRSYACDRCRSSRIVGKVSWLCDACKKPALTMIDLFGIDVTTQCTRGPGDLGISIPSHRIPSSSRRCLSIRQKLVASRVSNGQVDSKFDRGLPVHRSRLHATTPNSLPAYDPSVFRSPSRPRRVARRRSWGVVLRS